MADATEIKAALDREGLAMCIVPKGSTREFLQRFGDIIEETEVRQRKAAKTYLSGREAVPLHTDHPEADFVAWRCQTQDLQDGASVLADGHAILRAMGTKAESLSKVELHVPPQLPRQAFDRTQAWDGNRLYYAPWYPVVQTDDDGRRALKVFAGLLAMGFGHRRIRLKAGELLIIENGRWLHGRDTVPEGSARFFQRYWLRRRLCLG